MQDYSRLAKRYASALAELGGESGRLENLFADMTGLRKTYLESEDFRVFLKSPVIHPIKKAAVLKLALSQKVEELTMKFIEKLARERRENYLGEIAAAFISHYNRLQGVVTVEVVTAIELNDAGRKEIRQQLNSIPRCAAAKRIDLVEITDPEVIGGIKIQVDDLMADATIARQIRDLKKVFEENPYARKY
jgi:F-type H+-transporting ATPase subunit delta